MYKTKCPDDNVMAWSKKLASSLKPNQIYVHFCTKTLWRAMDPAILPPVMG